MQIHALAWRFGTSTTHLFVHISAVPPWDLSKSCTDVTVAREARAMVALWGPPTPAAPATVPTDTIIPVHAWDDTALCRAAVLYDLMRFDDVLDAGRLRTSLEKLLLREGWRKLGARVRLNVSPSLITFRTFGPTNPH
jgi:hypothetical protein